jgi:hypothetical protein
LETPIEIKLAQEVPTQSPILEPALRDNLSSNSNADSIQPEIVQSWQTINLSSDCGLNYTRLRDLLKARQWKEADEETHAIMLKLAEKEGKLGFQIQDINRLPNRDIWTIDQLWVNFSNKVFGFSIQKSIYEYEDKDFTKFAEKVGWKKEKLNNKQYHFSLF